MLDMPFVTSKPDYHSRGKVERTRALLELARGNTDQGYGAAAVEVPAEGTYGLASQPMNLSRELCRVKRSKRARSESGCVRGGRVRVPASAGQPTRPEADFERDAWTQIKNGISSLLVQRHHP